MIRDVSRREFLGALAAGAAALALPSIAGAQQGGNSMAAPMTEGGYKEVRRPARGTTPSMTADARDALEHHLHCQCGTCTLDVYTCRTTDFNCPVSPAMHRDAMALVAGGYSAQEILDAFSATYGERVLMAPTKSGFNWAGYLVPSVAVGIAGVLVLSMLARWRAAPPERALAMPPSDVTHDERARLDAALRNDS
ncbi:MAG: cytochrome c-type biogenesis protein CcmH [Gemmatimonadaceae bacterium]